MSDTTTPTPTTPAADTITALTDPAELRTLRTLVTDRLATVLTHTHGDEITPGRRVRLIRISPVCMANLTGTVQPHATGKKTTGRADVLLDESSTEALRRDHRVENTRRATRPADDVKRHLLPSIPLDCMILADHDS
ncbi:hypothetical protein [Streptomyces sp. NBC_00557]|uniref:hypothetical protein n=1 Tax=Streptomyces sp. NBC_00557 TaxID=2975776 RepID=UPI002E801007|nr:hypothetical protein [Streptomyces sp. NBC_00557]WUC39675.1 hypothetical protein OG956_38610 [Streptomyces sp. NBC_00557]